MAEETNCASEQSGFNPVFDHDFTTKGPLQLLKVEREYAQFRGGGPLEDEVVTVCEPAAQVFRKVQDALASHSEAQHLTESIQNSLATAQNDTAEMQSAFTANTEAMAKIKDFLDACVASFPTRMRPTSQSHVKAEKVFSMAELLEAIFLYLSPMELLQAVRVNHATSQIFKDSPKLLDNLQLRAHKDGHLSSIFGSSGFDGLNVGIDTSRVRQELSVHGRGLAFHQITVEVDFHSHSNPKIGSLCRSMLILQPPVRSMKVNVGCCSPRRRRSFDDAHWANSPGGHGWGFNAGEDEEAALARAMAMSQREESENIGGEDLEGTLNARVTETLEIQAEGGITVGHIHDAVQKIRHAHRHCPHAALHDHDSDGTVKPDITFSTIMHLQKNDPYLVEKDKIDIRSRLRDLDPDHNQGVMQIYVDSKKRAFENKWPILSFEDFKTKYDVDGAVGRGRDFGGGWANRSQQPAAW